MSISAGMVKELRDKTGAGMMDCKSALTETSGDMEAAVDWLRAKGLAKAAKKAGRVAAEGLIAVAGGGNARGHGRGQLGDRLRRPQHRFPGAGAGRSPRRRSAPTVRWRRCSAAPMPGGGGDVDHAIKSAIATIGENISLRRVAELSVGNGVVGTYVHGAVVPGLGKIGVLVGIESTGATDKLEQIGKQVAMHIAAASPLAVRVEELDQAVVERERKIFAEQARESGKPEAIIDKMVEGRLRKFYEEVVLLSQAFVVDTDRTVKEAVAAVAKEAGSDVAVTAFVCFRLGEGIEKVESDFAAEVAAAAGTGQK